MRGNNLLIFVFPLNFFQKIFQAKTQRRSFWKPHGQTFTHRLREHEKFQFFSDFAVVAFFGFFQHHQILIEHLFLWKSDTVNTGKHLALFITAPVSTCNSQHFNGFDFTCIFQVRSTTKVGEISLRI